MTPARRPATTNWASCRQRRVIPARRRGGEWHVRIDDVDTAVEQHEICPGLDTIPVRTDTIAQ